MFKIFMKRSHPPFDCPIAGFYFRVAFTVLNASSLHMRIPNQQRAPCGTPWGGSTAATVSALSPTHVRRDLLSTQINVRPAAYLTHTRVPRTKTLKRPDIILFSIALKCSPNILWHILLCKILFYLGNENMLFFSSFSLPSPKRTPKPQNHAHLSFRLRVTFCSQRTFNPLQWLWSRPTHPCCLPSSAPRALSQSQLPGQAPLVPPSLTPHNTVDSLAYFSVGAAGPCCSTRGPGPPGTRSCQAWQDSCGNRQKVPWNMYASHCDVEACLFRLCSAQHSQARTKGSILVAFHSQRRSSRSQGPSMFWVFTRISLLQDVV